MGMEHLPHQVTACLISNSCQQQRPKYENRVSKTQKFLGICFQSPLIAGLGTSWVRAWLPHTLPQVDASPINFSDWFLNSDKHWSPTTWPGIPRLISTLGTDLFSSSPGLLLQPPQDCDQSRHLQQQSRLQRGLAPSSTAWNCSHHRYDVTPARTFRAHRVLAHKGSVQLSCLTSHVNTGKFCSDQDSRQSPCWIIPSENTHLLLSNLGSVTVWHSHS